MFGKLRNSHAVDERINELLSLVRHDAKPNLHQLRQIANAIEPLSLNIKQMGYSLARQLAAALDVDRAGAVHEDVGYGRFREWARPGHARSICRTACRPRPPSKAIGRHIGVMSWAYRSSSIARSGNFASFSSRCTITAISGPEPVGWASAAAPNQSRATWPNTMFRSPRPIRRHNPPGGADG